MRVIVTVAAFFFLAGSAAAIPQFSAISGNRCINCHITPSGGGVRNDLGWYSWYDVGMVPRTNSLVSWIYDKDSSNQMFDGKLTLGFDGRLQSTRSFSSESAPRRFFPMQTSVYAAYTPIPEVTLEGAVNLASVATADAPRYDGQRGASMSALIAPSFSLPSLRVGLFRPSIGMRYDDHTMAPYSYTLATQRKTVVAPDWSEFGAEVTYEGLRWLTLQAGVFGSQALSKVKLSDGVTSFAAVQGNQPTLTARAVFWPRAYNDRLNMWFGGSILRNGAFGISSGFAGIGISDELSVLFDYTQMHYARAFSSQSYMAEVLYEAATWCFPYIRAERYYTDQASATGTYYLTNSATIGAQIFVIPYVELRPEYRLWDTWMEGYTSRWNVQVHIFY